MAKKIINIRLEESVWQQAKVGAALQGMTLQDWLTERRKACEGSMGHPWDVALWWRYTNTACDSFSVAIDILARWHKLLPSLDPTMRDIFLSEAREALK